MGEWPDPAEATSLDGLAGRLRLLKVRAGDPSYEEIKNRVNAAWLAAGRPAAGLTKKVTVADCFRDGRRRLNTDLVLAIVHALHPDAAYVARWRRALRVIGGETRAAARVSARDSLPAQAADFTGRDREIAELRRLAAGGGVVAVTGMPGVGKTRLAVHTAGLLVAGRLYDRVLFADLRGCHPDEPPADPAAVLDGLLRLLGVPPAAIPQPLPARAALYRERLAGARAIVLLDDAADEAHAAPLLPEVPGCLALVTTRRRPAGTPHLTLDVFGDEEAVAYLGGVAGELGLPPDPAAAARIARDCGHLPLALSLVAAHMRGHPAWSLADQADRLAEQRDRRRLDDAIERALHPSYRRLPEPTRRTLRMLALHPGPDLEAAAAAALAGLDPAAAAAELAALSRDHLLRPGPDGWYGFHDQVRAYLLNRGRDEDRPADRQAALRRLHVTAPSIDALHSRGIRGGDRRRDR